MKKEWIIVDGYNVLYEWGMIKYYGETYLEDARMELINMLDDYRAIKGVEIVVVFDAYKVKRGQSNIKLYGGVTVIYTKRAELADSYIEKFSRDLVGDYTTVKVVTSDALEQIIILGRGALRISAREFKEEVFDEIKSVRKDFVKDKMVKNNLLIDNLDQETVELLEDMLGK